MGLNIPEHALSHLKNTRSVQARIRMSRIGRGEWLISLRFQWRASDGDVRDPRFAVLVSTRVCVVLDLEVRIIEPNQSRTRQIARPVILVGRKVLAEALFCDLDAGEVSAQKSRRVH